MAIDMAALGRAAEGDADAKVTVRKAWLREVHRKLAAAAAAEAELGRQRRAAQMLEGLFGGFGRR